MFDIWTQKQPLAEHIYEQDNFKIVQNLHSEGNCCVIFFSSNNVWFPNTEESFRYSFIDNDYYEWLKYSNINAKKIIYFRDVYKQWYVTGINKRINNILSLLDFIRSETQGMDLVTVGSSAGGYIAALTAAVLNAERCICFSGQFSLKASIYKSPFLRKYDGVPRYSQWYELYDYIEKSRTTIYYIMPAYNEVDDRQYQYIKSLNNVKCLRIASKYHGVPVLKGNLWTILNMTKSEINAMFETYNEKIVGKIRLSIALCGLWKTLHCLVEELNRLMVKKLRRINK